MNKEKFMKCFWMIVITYAMINSNVENRAGRTVERIAGKNGKKMKIN